MGVNKKKRGRPAADRLSEIMIVEAAQAMMFNEGQKLSIRGLARELDVDAMAIYYYFDNKNMLLEAVAVHIMDGIYMPRAEGQWESELETLSLSYLTLLRDHPGLLETLLSMMSVSLKHVAVFQSRFDAALASITIDDATRQAVRHLLVDYLHGFALAMHTSDKDGQLAIDDMKPAFELILGVLRDAID